MPRPKSEREAWREELGEAPAPIERHQKELEATAVGDKERRRMPLAG